MTKNIALDHPSPANKLRIIVLGYIVRGPLGGLAWHHLQYVIGLARLGHDVYFVEDSDDYESCYDPSRGIVGTDPSYGLRFAQRVFDRFGFGDKWVFYDAHKGVWHGPLAHLAKRRGLSADLLLNVSAVNPIRPWMLAIPKRAMIDTDPVFTQIRNLTDPDAKARADLHTAFFTFGENYANDGASIPIDGFPWRPTRQPVDLDAWPVLPIAHQGRLTTVMQWDSYSAATYDGRYFGMKSKSFAPFIELPKCFERRTDFELALGKETAPRDMLADHGWRLADPLRVTRDPWTYQSYIQDSTAEFTVAKHGYVVTRSGWFSERSAAYLASGRPVITQETGFSDWLLADGGVFAFSTLEEAVAGIEVVNANYVAQSRIAREVAAGYFDSRVVLSRLVEEAMQSDWATKR